MLATGHLESGMGGPGMLCRGAGLRSVASGGWSRRNSGVDGSDRIAEPRGRREVTEAFSVITTGMMTRTNGHGGSCIRT